MAFSDRMFVEDSEGYQYLLPYNKAWKLREKAAEMGRTLTPLRRFEVDGVTVDVPYDQSGGFAEERRAEGKRVRELVPYKDDLWTGEVRWGDPAEDRAYKANETVTMNRELGGSSADRFFADWGKNIAKGFGQVGMLAPKAVVGATQLVNAALERATSFGGAAENPVSRWFGALADDADANRRWLEGLEAKWLDTRPKGVGKGAEIAYDVTVGARDLAGQLLLGGGVSKLAGLVRGGGAGLAAPRVAAGAPALKTTMGAKVAEGAKALAKQPKAYPALMAAEQFGETHAAARGNGKAEGEAFRIAGMDAFNSYLLSVADQVGGSLTRAAGEGLGRSAKAWFLQGLTEPTGGAVARKILRGVGIESGTEALDAYQHLTALQEAGVELTEADKLTAAAVGGLYGAVASGFAEGVGAAVSRRERAIARQLWAAERLAGAAEAQEAARKHAATGQAPRERGDVRLTTAEPGGARLVREDGSVLFGDGTEVRPDGSLRTAMGVVTDALGVPETVAPPRGERTTAGDVLDLFGLIRGADVKTVNVPTEGLRVNERIRQFKEDADPETGVVAGEQLQGAFQPIPSKPILVMAFEDGALEVVTGRHRLDLARQNGMATIPANLIYERDGWTPEAARVMDAYDNILDGKGSDQDFVHFFRTTKLDERTIAEHPELWARKRQQDARAVAKGATEDLYSLVMGRDRHMTLDVAAAIVREAPEGSGPYAGNIQRAVTRAVLQEGLRADDAAIMARSLRQAYTERAEARGMRQLDLFGNDETFELAMGLEAKFAAGKVSEIDYDLRGLRTAVGRQSGNLSVREGLIKKYGLKGADDVEGMSRAIARLEEEKRRWQNYFTDPELAKQASAFARETLHMDDPAAELPDGRMGTLDGVLNELEGEANAQMRAEAERVDAREAELSVGPLYTGAGVAYERPSLVAVNSGEGAQVYGWGLYASDQPGVARSYAEDRRHEAGASGNVAYVNGRNLTKMIEQEDFSDIWDYGDFDDAIEAIGDSAVAERIGNDFIDALQLSQGDYKKDAQSWAKLVSEEYGDGPEADYAQALAESVRNGAQAAIHEQTWWTHRPEGDESHLISWFWNLTKKQKDWIRAQAKKEGIAFDEDELGSTGESVYKTLSDVLGSPRAASEFLYRAGIDGVKYPVNASHGGTGEDGWNYVAFSDEHLRVDRRRVWNGLDYEEEASFVSEKEDFSPLPEARMVPGAEPGRFSVESGDGDVAAVEAGDGMLAVSGLSGAGRGAPMTLLDRVLGSADGAQVALTPEDARLVAPEGLGRVMEHNRTVAKVSAERFFEAPEGSVRVPLFLLRPGKDEPVKSVRNAMALMRSAARGERGRRAPVDVVTNADGTYTLADGNASSLAMEAMGGCEVIARVVGRNTGTRLGNSALALANVNPPGDGVLRTRGLDGLEPAAALEKAYRQAEANAPRLTVAVEAAAKKVGGRAMMRSGLKGIERAAEKVTNDYGGDASRLVDITGGTVILPDTADFGDALKGLKGALPEGASVAKVKKFNVGDGAKGYGDIKVSVRFPNGGIGEVVLVSEHMNDAKFNRGGHLVYEIQRVLGKYEGLTKEIDEAIEAMDELSNALYARGPGAPGAASFESMKARASSSVTRLLGPKQATRLSAADINVLKSLSSKLHLAAPPSQRSYAMPALSLIKNATDVPPDNDANVAQTEAMRQVDFPTAGDLPEVPAGVELNALPRSPLEVTVYPNGGRVPAAGSPAADASALELRLDHVVELYRQLAGKFPKVVARRDRGPGEALGWFDPKTQDVMVRAQLFGLLDASDRQVLHDRLRARGLFRNEDAAWCAKQTRKVVDHERRFSEARLGEEMRKLMNARIRSGRHTGAGAKVMAHELWHLIDASDGIGTRQHGNLLGHLANLKGFFGKSLPEGVFGTDAELMAEAQAFIRWWRGVGFDEAHFAQAHEAYAEMGAALFLDPGAVQRRAPLFYAAMLEGMKRHPKAFEAWEATRKAIEEGRDGKDLTDRLERGWRVAEEAEARRLAAEIVEPTAFDRKMEATRVFLDRYKPMVMVAERSQRAVRRRLAADLKAGNLTRGDYEARVAELDEELLDVRFRKNLYTHQYGASKLFLADLNGKVLQASERLGVEMTELAKYLHLQRVIELGGRATAYAIDPPRARQLLNEMARTRGLAKMKDIRRLANVFRALYEQHVINNADVRAMLGEKTIAMMEKNKHYITMRHNQDPEAIERWLKERELFSREHPGEADPLEMALQEVRGLTSGAGRSGVGYSIHRLEGSFRPTANPVTATAQTAVEILEAAQKNAAVLRLAKALEGRNFPDFKVLGPGDRRVLNKRYGTLEFMEGCVRKAVRVPRQVADAFNEKSLTVPMLTKLTRFLNATYTTNAPTFALTALPRDLNSLSQNIKGLRRSPLYWLTALNVGALIPGIGPLKAVKGLANFGAWAAMAAQWIPPQVMRRMGENPLGRLIFGRDTVEYWTSFGNKVARIIQSMDFERTLEAAARARAAGNVAKAQELEYCVTMARHALEDGVLLTMNQTRRDDYQTSDLGRLFDKYHLKYERSGARFGVDTQALRGKKGWKGFANEAGRLAAKPLTAYWESAGYFNELQSMTVKLAGYCFLHDKASRGRGFDAAHRREIALKAADRAGDPDFSAKGMVANMVEMFTSPFWNARKEGFLRGVRAFKEHPADWTGKAIAHGVAPRLSSLILVSGVLGDALLDFFFDGDEEKAQEAMANGSASGELYKAVRWHEQALRNVSPYTMENFRVVPLWMNAAGTDTFALRIPIPDEARVADMATLAMWNRLGLGSQSPARGWADVARALGDQVLFDPSGTGSAFSFIEAWAGPYLFGTNPWESYRQANMYDTDEFKARWNAPKYLAESVGRQLWNRSPLVGALRLRRGDREGELSEEAASLKALFSIPLVGAALSRMSALESEGRRQTVMQHREVDQAEQAALRLLGREAAEARLSGRPAPDAVWESPDAVGYMLEYEQRAQFQKALGPKGRALDATRGIKDPERRMEAVRWVNGM